MNEDPCCEVCITAPDLDWLTDFTRRLITERLAACGHITAPVRSIYRWDGTVHDETEARVALHTRQAHIETIVATTNAAHPYELPGIFALPLLEASPAYLSWVREQTTDPDRHRAPIDD